jgi:hypothetical protein
MAKILDGHPNTTMQARPWYQGALDINPPGHTSHAPLTHVRQVEPDKYCLPRRTIG